ncbi:alginate export family protein [Ancylomarina sp. YFZ004]
MKKLLLLLVVLIGALLPNTIMAQLKFTGEMRPRTEYRNGLKTLFNSEDDAALFTSQRTRLNLNYTDAKFKVGLSLQDVRTWGDVKQLNMSDKNQLMLHEAWGELLFTENFSLKVGRQELVYDDSRILGNVGWAQQARSHDLALLKFKTDDKGQLHIGLAYNNDMEGLKDQLYTTSYKSMQFAWYNRKYDNFNFSLLFLNNGLQRQDGDDLKTYYSQTLGAHMNHKKDKFGLTGSAYLQMGKDAADRDLSAYLVSLGANYALSSNFKGNIGFEIQSGTDSNEQNANFDNKSFTPLFGTNHKFNGHMDYFYVGNHTSNVGLVDAFIGGSYSKDKISFGATLHRFATQADLFAAGEKQDNYLGTELDLSFGYKYSKSVTFKMGYSQMFASDSMEVLKGVNDAEKAACWGWMMLVFKPNFLK